MERTQPSERTLSPATHESKTPVWWLVLRTLWKSEAGVELSSPVKAHPPQPHIGVKHRCGAWFSVLSGSQRRVWSSAAQWKRCLPSNALERNTGVVPGSRQAREIDKV